MPYEIDRKDDTWSLADYVDKGIDMLDNKKGFFMMVEGGKIDWACHANDAASALDDTLALDDAVGRAVKFYNKHPDETLIIVTGDHETGGSLVLTSYEYQELKDAYQTTLNRTGAETEYAQDEYIKYGSYEPLTVTITHILNNKSGVSFSSYSHTGLPTEVLVQGAGSFGLVTVAPFTAVMAGTILTRHGRSRDRDEQIRLPDGRDE